MGIETLLSRSPIAHAIKQAGKYYFKEKERLFSDPQLIKLLPNLKTAILDSKQAMEGIGIMPLCRECEQKEGGSCCGKGLENKYSETLLLINLLLGVTLPKKRNDPKSCFFLGEEGCLLAARHVICVNYLCPKITSNIKPYKISLLREKEGVELDILFLTNERIKKLLKDAG